MAKFQFKCTQCGKVLEVDDAYCGKVVECPYCEKGIVVPIKPLERETPLRRRMYKNPFEDTFQVSMSSTKATTAKRNMAKLKFDCPWCGLKVEVDETLCGNTMTCPSCEKDIVVPNKWSMRTSIPNYSNCEILEIHPSIGHYFIPLSFSSLCLAGMLVVGLIGGLGILFGIMFIIPLFFVIGFIVLLCYNTKYTVTGNRVVAESGILVRFSTEVEFRDVRAIMVTRSLSDMLMGLASVHIATAATGGTEIVLKSISEWERVKHEINYRKGNG